MISINRVCVCACVCVKLALVQVCIAKDLTYSFEMNITLPASHSGGQSVSGLYACLCYSHRLNASELQPYDVVSLAQPGHRRNCVDQALVIRAMRNCVVQALVFRVMSSW